MHMFAAKINNIIIFFLSILTVIQTLIELPAVEDNNIAYTETVIRNTVNNLFGALKIQNVKHRPRLKHFSTIHNFFASITLTDCDNLKQIARLAKVNDFDNSSQHFIQQVNEVLNESDKDNETNDTDVYVTEYIDKFIKQIKYLKKTYVSSKNVDINEEILRYIDEEHQALMSNITDEENISKKNESDENLLSDNEFWQPSGRRIYHGIRTRIKKFPFIASVQFFLKFQCAGSVIKSDLVITSSSCLQLAWNNRFFRENPAFLSVQVGSHFYEGSGDNIAVLEIYFHPHYDPKTLSNNLAVMRLTRKIRFKKNVRKVKKIDIDKNPWPLPANTEKVIVIGWGAKGADNIIYNPFINKLSYAELTVYPLTYCQDHYSREFVTRTNFCAGFVSKGGGACNRDAGGPGIVDDTLMGVISFGSPICGAPDAPTVFTKLGYYHDWITNIMKQVVPNVLHYTTRKATRTIPRLPMRTTTTKRKLLPIIFSRKTTTTTTTVTPARDVEALRTEDQDFKDFLSTMFGSDVDLDSTETKAKKHVDSKAGRTDTESSIENVIIDTSKIKVTRMDEDMSETEMTTSKSKYTVEPTHWVTADDDSSEEIVAGRNNKIEDTESTTKIKTTDNESKIDETLEIDIMTLIDNLDLKEYIKPAEPLYNLTKSGNKQTKSIERNIAIETSDESSENSVQISPKQQSVLNFLFLSEETKDKNKVDDDDEDRGGMSIQAEDFNDLTFRDKHDKNKTNDLLTESSLYELISLAIDEEAKRIHKKKRYIL